MKRRQELSLLINFIVSEVNNLEGIFSSTKKVLEKNGHFYG
jgi:hypothetical protein